MTNAVKIMKSKWPVLAAVLTGIILMLAVWPGGMIRRDVEITSGGNNPYGYSAELTTGEVYEQYFVAMGDKLCEHSVAFSTAGDISDDLVLRYELKKENGEVLYTEDLFAGDIRYSEYQTFIPDVKLKKNALYSFSITAVSGSENLTVVCTPLPVDYAPGFRHMTVDGNAVTYTMYSSFMYDMKLNAANTIFTWLTIWLVIAALVEVCLLRKSGKENSSKLS